MRNIYILLGGFALVLVMFACDGSKNVTMEAQTSVGADFVFDSTKVQFNNPVIDSVHVICTDDESRLVVENDEWIKLADIFSTAAYDTKWNDTGIMVKMVAPDYTFIIQYRGKGRDGDDWLMYWEKGQRIKYKGKWFVIDEQESRTVCEVLDSYRHSVK